MFCIPIIAKTGEEALHKIATAWEVADLFEMRLDLMEIHDLKRIIHESKKIMDWFSFRYNCSSFC